MTSSDLLRSLLRNWVLLVLGTTLGLAVAAGATLLITPQYSATSQMFVQYSEAGKDATDANQANDFAAARVKSYVDLAVSPAVLNQVISQLKLDDTPATLARRITVENPLDTVLLSVTVSDPSADRAAAVANTMTTVFPKFAERIETPNGRNTSPVRITATETAEPPQQPSSPDRALNLAIGALLGLALTIAVVVIREVLAAQVRTPADLERVTDWPQLGSIPADRAFGRHPVVPAEETSGRSEAFRQLRTYLQFRRARTSPVIMVTSAGRNEGRTVVAVNLAVSLARAGTRVVLVDANLRAPAVARVLRLGDADGLSSVLAGAVEPKDVLMEVRGEPNLLVMSSGARVANPAEVLGSRAMHDALEALADMADVVVVDAPPLLSVADGMALCVLTDTALVVARSGQTRRNDVVRVEQTLGSMEVTVIGCVLNAASASGGGGYGDPGEGQYLPGPVRPFVPGE